MGFAGRGPLWVLCVSFGFFLGIFSDESVFRFEYFGTWVFVGVFLGGAAMGGCFDGAIVRCRCY